MTFTSLESERHPSARPSLNICVFCGARSGNSPVIVDLARDTGRLIGQRGHGLIYGGGGSGMMGAMAWAAAEHGARIKGVIPHFLYEREQHIAAPAQETQLTDNLHRRKEHMQHLADAFLALPGGFGTLDEILEVISAGYLGLSDKPLVIVNAEGVWDSFMELVETLRRFELISGAQQPTFQAANTPEEALDLLERLVLAPSARLGRV